MAHKGAKIFISYRRLDAAGYALYLYDRLIRDFGQSNVFYDLDSIYAGNNFPQRIAHALKQCAAAVVIIGPQWLTITDDRGRRRLDDESDFVRLEIETALRHNVPILPLLVGHAVMPAASSLPSTLTSLVQFEAFSLQSGGQSQHLNKFMDAIGHAVSPPREVPLPPRYTDPPKARRTEPHWAALTELVRVTANSRTTDIREMLHRTLIDFSIWKHERRWDPAADLLKENLGASRRMAGLEITAHQLRVAFDRMTSLAAWGFLGGFVSNKSSREHVHVAFITALFEAVCHVALDNRERAGEAISRAVKCFAEYDRELDRLAPYASYSNELSHAHLKQEVDGHLEQKPQVEELLDILAQWIRLRSSTP